MGMDIDNAQHGVGLADALTGVEDLDAFIEYCRDKKNGIEYSNRVEKLDTLATSYKKMQSMAKLPHDTANGFSSKLDSKVKKARTFLKNELEVGNDRPFSRLKIDGESYFTEKELTALAGVGSSRFIIEASEQGILADEFKKFFMSKYTVKKKYESLTDGQKKVKALVRGEK